MTPHDARAMYRRGLEGSGEIVRLQRVTPGKTYEVPVLARVTGFDPDELVGGIQEGDRKVIALAEDIEASDFPAPPRDGDRIVIRGKTLGIAAVDDSTRRIGGVILAFDIVARG